MLHNFISDYDGVTSTIKWGLPYYTYRKPLCYINPQKPLGVEVVFWHAVKMPISLPLLDQKKRRWFAGITYRTLEDVDFEILNSIIQEARTIDPG